MAKDNNLSDFLKDIADALREKLGITEPINPQEFSTLIKSIEEYETVGEAVDRIIDKIPSLVANGTLTDTKWAKVSTVKGNSVAWNQLVNHSHWTSTTNNGITFTVEDDGKIVVNGTATGLARIMVNPYFGLKANHKYVLTGTPNNSNGVVLRYFGTGLRDEGNGSIINITTDAYNALAIEATEGLTVNNAIFYPRLTDLTLMFGAGNEPTTIEEFEARKPIGVTNDYNEGEILSYQQWGEKIVWNQLTKSPQKNGTIYANKTYCNAALSASVKEGVYCIKCHIDTDVVIKSAAILVWDGSSNSITPRSDVFDNTLYYIVRIPKAGTGVLNLYYDTIDENKPFTSVGYIHDLTLMFGAGNEPTTIEEFERRKPRNVSNEYNEGTEINGDIEVKTVGLNQWDEEWENGLYSVINGNNKPSNSQIRSANYIPVIPNCFYKTVVKSKIFALWWLFFDANKDLITGVSIEGISNSYNGFNITNKEFKTPSSAHYVKFYATTDYGSTYNNDICLHLVQDGLVSQYKPYTSTITPLPNVSLIKDADGNQLFPYGLCSAGSVYDEINGTKAIKRVGVVDMGTLDWVVEIAGNVYKTESLAALISKL